MKQNLSHRLPIHPSVWGFLAVFVWGQFAFTPETASAQRLLDRIRARMQQRATPPRSNTPNAPDPEAGDAASDEAGSGPDATDDRVLARPLGANRDGGADARGTFPSALGLRVQPFSRGNLVGLLVEGFTSESNAENAGIRPGDVIVEIGGAEARSLEDAGRIIETRSPGEVVEVRFVRGGRLYRTRLRLTTRRPQPAMAIAPGRDARDGSGIGASTASLGLEVSELRHERGVLVTKAPEEKAGYFFGLRAQDRIVSIDGRITRSPSDLLREIRLRSPGQKVRLGLVRGSTLLEQTVVLADADGLTPSDLMAQADTDAAQGIPGDTSSIPGKTSDSLMTGLGSVLGGFLKSKQADETIDQEPGNPRSPEEPLESGATDSLELPPE
ncbi:MAG: PDZ domain-containing protein [Planctomycetota bacterium]